MISPPPPNPQNQPIDGAKLSVFEDPTRQASINENYSKGICDIWWIYSKLAK